VYVQATSFDGVFLLVAFHYIALVCNYCFLLWLMKKYLSIYPSIYQKSLFVDIQIEDEDFCRFSDFLKL